VVDQASVAVAVIVMTVVVMIVTVVAVAVVAREPDHRGSRRLVMARPYPTGR
jgi:hypothetical protein